MITDIILYTFGFFIKIIALILPAWDIWPDEILLGLNYFFTSIAKFNFIIPINTIFTCLLLLINFLIIYYSSKLIFMIINFFRGSGEIKI
jgi:hypothetical protein